MKQKKQERFDVGKKVRHISREMFHGKLPSEKTMRDRKKFHKGSRGNQRRDSEKSDFSPFIMFQMKHAVYCAFLLWNMFQVKHIPNALFVDSFCFT